MKLLAVAKLKFVKSTTHVTNPNSPLILRFILRSVNHIQLDFQNRKPEFKIRPGSLSLLVMPWFGLALLGISKNDIFSTLIFVYCSEYYSYVSKIYL